MNDDANGKIDGKVVVITGASSGFGRGAALKFASSGARLVLAARRDHLLDDLARECETEGGEAIAVPTDVSEPEEVRALCESTIGRFGRIDVWVNNAGVGALGHFEEIPIEDHIQVIKTDLLGTLYGSYYAVRQFKQQLEGVLINIASVIGIVPSPHYASYAAAKHGVVGLSSVLRQELTLHGFSDIHVCTVLPTSTDTPFFQHAANYTGHQVKPIPPVHDAQEVVDTIVRLASEPEDNVAVGGSGEGGDYRSSHCPEPNGKKNGETRT